MKKYPALKPSLLQSIQPFLAMLQNSDTMYVYLAISVAFLARFLLKNTFFFKCQWHFLFGTPWKTNYIFYLVTTIFFSGSKRVSIILDRSICLTYYIPIIWIWSHQNFPTAPWPSHSHNYAFTTSSDRQQFSSTVYTFVKHCICWHCLHITYIYVNIYISWHVTGVTEPNICGKM